MLAMKIQTGLFHRISCDCWGYASISPMGYLWTASRRILWQVWDSSIYHISEVQHNPVNKKCSKRRSWATGTNWPLWNVHPMAIVLCSLRKPIMARGSHLRVTCRSICHRDQMESSDRRSFWELTKGSRRILSNQSTHFLGRRGNAFVLCKSSDQELWKGKIKWSRTIFTNQDSWSRSQMLLWAICKWLHIPLVWTGAGLSSSWHKLTASVQLIFQLIHATTQAILSIYMNVHLFHGVRKQLGKYFDAVLMVLHLCFLCRSRSSPSDLTTASHTQPRILF